MDLFTQIQQIEFSAPLPATLLEVEQRFDAPKVDDLTAATRRALESSGLLARVQPGASVAVGVGSRGVANLPIIVRAAVARLREAGAEPYIVPAMGSHGGATVEGQLGVLAQLGVTEASTGAPLRATMEVREIGQVPSGLPEGMPQTVPLYQGLDSAAADHTLLISRIKPHTDFRGEVESGPAKMAVIGLGKQKGALAMHALGGAAFQRYLIPAARVYGAATNLLGAIAIVENAYDETAQIEGLPAADIGAAREAALLRGAKELMASLPFAAVDVLVVRRLGKDVSGTGMDTNVIGRLLIPRQPETFGAVDVAVIVALDLTEATHGNATGMGLANITTARLARKIDWISTHTNGLTSGIFSMFRGSLPMVMADDRRALMAASHCCAVPHPATRMVLIEDTLHVGRLWISPALRGAAEAHPRLRIVGEHPLAFSPAGDLLSPWCMPAASA
jgi:hypothetical protein